MVSPGATPVPVPLRDHTHDLPAMLAAVTDRTRLIFVCNPNNPTSTVVPPDDLAAFVRAVPEDVVVCIDEAYVEYIRDGMLPDSIGLARALLTDPAPVGRKFDFLMQEFMREANTLCSKSASPALTGCGLDLKALIEQLREQVQNVE